jgi:hypothetical protein
MNDTVVAYFKILSGNLLGITELKHNNHIQDCWCSCQDSKLASLKSKLLFELTCCVSEIIKKKKKMV